MNTIYHVLNVACYAFYRRFIRPYKIMRAERALFDYHPSKIALKNRKEVQLWPEYISLLSYRERG